MFNQTSPDKRINNEIKSTNNTEAMFHKRPFVVHSSNTQSNGEKTFNTSLSQAQKYGHSLNNARTANAGSSTQSTAVAQCKPSIMKRFSSSIDKKKEVGVEGGNVGSGISNMVGNAVEAAAIPAGGSTGVLALPAAVNDANDAIGAYKQGNKSEATTSGIKAATGGAGAGATIAGVAGDAINATAAGSVGGGATVVTGGIDAIKGGKNIKKAKDSYGEVKGVARGAAEKLSPQDANNKPRNTKELQGVLGRFNNLEGDIGEKRENVNSLTDEINNLTPKQKPDDNTRKALGESRNYRKSLKKQQKGLKNEKADLKKDKRHLDKSPETLDVLDVALHSADGLEKTKKREGVNTAAGGISAVGGGLAIAGAAGAGFGGIPGAAIGATGASLKPLAAGVRKGKQMGRDKGLRGFNQDKTTAKKDTERQRIAGKMTNRRDVPEMQTIFGNLPGVTEEQTNRFKDQQSTNPVSDKDIQEILKRRNY